VAIFSNRKHGIEMNKNISYMIAGVFFGVILTKSEVISWFRIQKMFRFEEAFMYLIIGSAVITGAFFVFTLKLIRAKSLAGETLDFKGKSYHQGFIWGGLIFGVGWAITGACPGPIFAQVGAGAYPAWFTLGGAITGAFLYHRLKSKLPH
jgi:uncharacterized membrane protein YedE/YeeE